MSALSGTKDSAYRISCSALPMRRFESDITELGRLSIKFSRLFAVCCAFLGAKNL